MEGRIFIWPPAGPLPEEYVGVMLERLKSSWVHIGFLYRTKTTQGSYILHLSGHRELRHETPQAGQLCVVCQIEPVRIPAVAAFARRLYRLNKNQGIPYAFSSPEQDWFSPEGQLLLGPNRLGLTCSNFVLALYRAAGLPLVQLETWPARAEDGAWQQSVLEEWGPDIANATQRTREHFEQVKKEIGTVRCRPAEVGGAALADQLPCDFMTAVKHAEIIERNLPAIPANPLT